MRLWEKLFNSNVSAPAQRSGAVSPPASGSSSDRNEDPHLLALTAVAELHHRGSTASGPKLVCSRCRTTHELVKYSFMQSPQQVGTKLEKEGTSIVGIGIAPFYVGALKSFSAALQAQLRKETAFAVGHALETLRDSPEISWSCRNCDCDNNRFPDNWRLYSRLYTIKSAVNPQPNTSVTQPTSQPTTEERADRPVPITKHKSKNDAPLKTVDGSANNTENTADNVRCPACRQALNLTTDRGTRGITCPNCRHFWVWSPPIMKHEFRNTSPTKTMDSLANNTVNALENIRCPACHQALNFSTDRGSYAITCPNCGHHWTWSSAVGGSSPEPRTSSKSALSAKQPPQNTAIISCPACTQRMRIPTNRGRLAITCSTCKHRWEWSPQAAHFAPSPIRAETPAAPTALFKMLLMSPANADRILPFIRMTASQTGIVPKDLPNNWDAGPNLIWRTQNPWYGPEKGELLKIAEQVWGKEILNESRNEIIIRPWQLNALGSGGVMCVIRDRSLSVARKLVDQV